MVWREARESEREKKKENDRNDVIDNGDTVGFHFDYIRQRQMVGNRTVAEDGNSVWSAGLVEGNR